MQWNEPAVAYFKPLHRHLIGGAGTTQKLSFRAQIRTCHLPNMIWHKIHVAKR